MSVTSLNLSSNNRKIEIGYFVIMNTTNYNNENEYCKITVARRICTFLRLRNVERNKIAELGPERSEGPSVAILSSSNNHKPPGRARLCYRRQSK